MTKTLKSSYRGKGNTKNEAFVELLLYRDVQKTASNMQQFSLQLVFLFVKKKLLPSLARKPGQLQFITGLKFDIFGALSSTL